MGRGPAAPGLYVSLEGGYSFVDGASVIGHGINPAGLLAGPTSDTSINSSDGWHAGLSIGYAAQRPLISGLPFQRAEAYLRYEESSGEANYVVAGAARTVLKSVDGAALAIVGVEAASEVKRSAFDAGLRLAVDQPAAGNTLSWVLNPFFRHAREETGSIAIGTADAAWRSAEVDSDLFGVGVMLEPELWLSQSVALTGRLGAGVYGYTARGSFRSGATVPAVFDAQLFDRDSGVGFRGQLGAGLKLRLTQGVTLALYGEADYFSRYAAASLPDNQLGTATTSRLDAADLWELRAGARVSLPLDVGGMRSPN